MFDFKRTKILFGFGILLLLGIAMVLITALKVDPFIGIFLFGGGIILYLIILQKYSAKAYIKWRQGILTHLDADAFLEEIERLVQTNKRFSHWQMIKEQDYALALMWAGQFQKARDIVQAIERDYAMILQYNTYSRFSMGILHALLDSFTDPNLFSSSFQTLQEAAHSLNEQERLALEQNKKSYYHLIMKIHDLMMNPEEPADLTLDEYPPLFQVVLLHFLIKQTQNEAKKTYYLNQLNTYTGSVFILKQHSLNDHTK